MATVMVDIDDTLYSFGGLARKMWAELAIERGDKNLQRGAYVQWGEWRSPTDVAGLDTWLEVIARCHHEDVILAQKPFDGAADCLWEVVNSGHEVRYLSNRHSLTTEATQQWLDMWDFPDGHLVCTDADKIPITMDCQYIIDDRPKTLVQFVYNRTWAVWHPSSPRLGFGLFGSTGDYNRALTDVPGIYLAPNWTLLGHYLRDKGVLSAAGVSN